MDHGDITAGEISPQRDRALTGGALAQREPACSVAMTHQGFGHGLQPWPQQFIRLVGGHRRPAPVQSSPTRS